MPTFTRWNDMEHKVPPEERARNKAEAIAEYESEMGYAELRKTRHLTQVDLAERLQLSQASIAGIEGREDVPLSTLSRYIKALGGELKMFAEFPDATVSLALPDAAQTKAKVQHA